MNEEMNNLEVIENYEVENYEEPETSGNGILGKVLVGTAIVGAGVAAFLYKNKEKLEARRIRKLEKKGYVITKIEKVENQECHSDECEQSK